MRYHNIKKNTEIFSSERLLEISLGFICELATQKHIQFSNKSTRRLPMFPKKKSFKKLEAWKLFLHTPLALLEKTKGKRHNDLK